MMSRVLRLAVLGCIYLSFFACGYGCGYRENTARTLTITIRSVTPDGNVQTRNVTVQVTK